MLSSGWLCSAASVATAGLPRSRCSAGQGGLALTGRIVKAEDDYLLRADLSGELETTCARCLEPARLAVDSQLTVTFVPADEDEEVDDDADVVGFAGNQIEIDDEVRDEILLAIPVQVLCTESCRGLCPVCGGNRNVVPCECEAERRESGSRFAALGKLKI